MPTPTENRADGYGVYRYPQRHTNNNPDRAYQDGYDDGYTEGLKTGFEREDGAHTLSSIPLRPNLNDVFSLEAMDMAYLQGDSDTSSEPKKDSKEGQEDSQKPPESILNFLKEFHIDVKLQYADYCNQCVQKGKMPVTFDTYFKIHVAKGVTC